MSNQVATCLTRAEAAYPGHGSSEYKQLKLIDHFPVVLDRGFGVSIG